MQPPRRWRQDRPATRDDSHPASTGCPAQHARALPGHPERQALRPRAPWAAQPQESPGRSEPPARQGQKLPVRLELRTAASRPAMRVQGEQLTNRLRLALRGAPAARAMLERRMNQEQQPLPRVARPRAVAELSRAEALATVGRPPSMLEAWPERRPQAVQMEAGTTAAAAAVSPGPRTPAIRWHSSCCCSRPFVAAGSDA